MKSVTVTKGIYEEVNAIYETSPSFLIKKGEESGITYEINLIDSIQAPITQGQLLGNIKYSLNETEIESVNLVAEISVNKISLLNATKYIFNSWFTLLRI